MSIQKDNEQLSYDSYLEEQHVGLPNCTQPPPYIVVPECLDRAASYSRRIGRDPILSREAHTKQVHMLKETHNDFSLLVRQRLTQVPKLDLPFRSLNPRLRAPHELSQNIQNQRQHFLIRMIGGRVFLDLLEHEDHPRESCDGPVEEDDEVAFADAWVLGALGQEVLVFGVATEFFAVVGFGDGVVFDV